MSSIQVNSSIYNSIYARKIKSDCLEKIDAEIIEDNELYSLRCNGFLTRSALTRYREFLLKYISLKDDGRNILLDIGCGFGGLGKWLSRKLDLDLIGIDFSEIAIQEAKASVSSDETNKFNFQVSSFYETGLEEESIAAAISLDSLYLATNPLNALREVNRVLKTSAPLIFTVYLESPRSNQGRFSIDYTGWKALLQATSFSIINYVDTTDCWRIQMRKKHEHRWAERQRIREELGTFAEAELSVSESMLGLNGKLSFIESVLRFEIDAVKE